MNEIFNDLKVIELASVLAGPAVGMFFSELGADVTKIENKNAGGDITRTWKLSKEDTDTPFSAYYCAVNYKKKVLMLNLREQQDRQKVYDLVSDADIVIANYKRSSALKLKMDYQTLKTYNDKLIYANISGFGEDSNRVAFDVVLQAESGFMFMNGQPDSPPTKMPLALIDILAAHQLKEGILIALLKRYKNNTGAYVSVSLLEAAVSSLANQATNWLMSGHIPQQMGSMHPNIAPYGELFKTKDDKFIVLAIGSDTQFQKLSAFLNRGDLSTNPSYSTNKSRVQNRSELFDELRLSFESELAENILTFCHQNFIPIGQVRNMQEVFLHDKAAEMILSENIEGFMTQRVSSLAFRIS
jgi:crotonobetainyl-CoA:carnitine CoA-transferase CaiB-like acyl-CoA transferase